MSALAGRVAWVVGASSGIGAAVARELADRGARVAISARRADQLEDVAGGRMLVVPADVTDRAAMAAAAATVAAELGPLDLVVISAGYWSAMRATEWDADEFERHVEVNLGGTNNTLAAVLPGMLSRRSGVVAGIASVAGYRGLAGSEAYGATKAAQINLFEALRISLGRKGIRVVTICPGFVRTEMTARNRFSMPFLIEADEAGKAICDGLERGRTEIVFPLPMAVVMKLARLVPVRVWAWMWRREG